MGGHIIAGITGARTLLGVGSDVYLIKTDQDGNVRDEEWKEETPLE